MKKHLLEGVNKNAFSAEVAEQKFEAWFKDKDSKIQAEKDKATQDKETIKNQRLEAEAKVKEKRAQAIAKKLSAAAKAEAAEQPAEQPADEATEQPASTEAPAAE